MDTQSLLDSSSSEPIALVGIGCRFPGGANSPGAFWKLLIEGVDPVSPIPVERWDLRRYYHADPAQPGKMYAQHASLLQDVDCFDASFFGIPPIEAACMDPQQRILLEVSWEALEDAGLRPQALAGSQTGVFVGICANDYGVIQRQDAAQSSAYSNAGGALSIAANRISYLLDFRGPSFSVDTACSSALVAVHLACESLRRGECSLALAAGVNIILDPLVSVGFSKASMLSVSGRCRSFDALADGFVRGEGAGVVVLKPLAQALADRDPVYGVIRGSAMNQDGHTSNLHYPSQAAQADLLSQLYAQTGISPRDVHYIETHGTGTIAGDFVECRALGEVFSPYHSLTEPLYIGSVKSNIGHLEGASGIAGLIKAALILRNRQIPANLHFQIPNPEVDFENLHLHVQTTTQNLPDSMDSCIVGVNSFGFGGTNAHVILQTCPGSLASIVSSLEEDQNFLMTLSSRNTVSLEALAHNYLQFLQADPVPSLSDICFSANLHREHHVHRLALVVRSHADLQVKLDAFLAKNSDPMVIRGQASKSETMPLAFVFSGNGPQWWGMGRQLLVREPLFRSVVERCDQLWFALAGWSLIEELLAEESCSRMEHTDIAQPTLFALQIALAEWWKARGIKPDAVIGHSVGEIAAAYVAGILSLEDAIQVVYHRGRLQELTVGQGMMVAVGVSAERARELIVPFASRISLAAINAPESVTLSGEKEALEDLIVTLTTQDIFCRPLKLNYAFHHTTMNPIREELLDCLLSLRPQDGQILFLSTVTGGPLDGTACDALYWWQNVRSPVQFLPGIQYLQTNGYQTFLEIGPNPVLSGYLADCYSEKQVTILPSLRRHAEDQHILLHSLASLYVLGFSVDWDHLCSTGNYVQLPTYPWHQERHWYLAQNSLSQHRLGDDVHALLGSRLAVALPQWENHFDRYDLLYLHEHVIDGASLFPAAGYVEIFLAAAHDHYRDDVSVSFEISQMQIHRPLFLSDDHTLSLQTVLTPEEGCVQIFCSAHNDWLLQASCQLSRLPLASSVSPFDLETLRTRCAQQLSGSDFYTQCSQKGINYGPLFQGIRGVALGEREALGSIQVPEAAEKLLAGYRFHPLVLDCCLQIAISLIPSESEQIYLPVAVERFRFSVQQFSIMPVYCYIQIVGEGHQWFMMDCTVFDERNRLLLTISGLRVQAANMGSAGVIPQLNQHLYEEVWIPAPLPSQQHVVSVLPSPSTLFAQLQSAPGQILRDQMNEQFYQKTRPSLNKIILTYIIIALRQLGWHFQIGERICVPELRTYLRILPHYERLLFAWCLMLVEEGILAPMGDDWVVIQEPEEVDLANFLRSWVFLYPENHLGGLLVVNCGRHLVEILTGELNPLSILFPDGDSTLLELFYTCESLARSNNGLVQEAIKQVVERLPEGKTLRILEVGAGTGGTTSYILPILPADRTTYIFTDISDVFLQRAKQKYRAFPFVEYQLFDVEQDLQSQGLDAGTFDLIVASNVIHATGAIRSTLDRIHRLLARGGLFCLVESTNPLSHVSLFVFGLLNDYWRFHDHDLRPHLTLLNQSQWEEVLTDAHFSDVVTLSQHACVGEAELSVFLAQKSALHLQQQVHPQSDSVWLLFADQTGLTTMIQETFKASLLIIVRKGECFQQCGPHEFQIRPHSHEDLVTLFQVLGCAGIRYEHIVYLWGVDPPVGELNNFVLKDVVDTACVSLIFLVQELLRRSENKASLWVVTTGIQGSLTHNGSLHIAQAPLYGLARTLISEHPELHPTLIALSAPETRDKHYIYNVEEIEALCEQMCTRSIEGEILLCGSSRFINRIQRVPLAQTLRSDLIIADGRTSFRLEASSLGTLDGLYFRTMPRKKPGKGEVEISVVATGLNFKDVALTMGIISAQGQKEGSVDLGLECAGTITSIGEGVSRFCIGDEVLAFGHNCFTPYLVVDEQVVVAKPAHLSMEEGSTILSVFLTTYYALHTVAKICAGERVLIHSAAGGIGLAAIQIVQAAGGEIFATAGNAEKRAYLQRLGVEHVFDSRQLTFAEEIMEATNGEGVDIVLNSLSGEAAAKSLGLLRSFGRFLEIGKRDFIEHRKLGLQPFERCISYFAIDLSRMLAERRSLVREIGMEMIACFEQGIYRPLPYTLFPAFQIQDAFRYMLQSKHIGKIIIKFQDQFAPVHHEPTRQPIQFAGDGTYLVTGGLTGFGLATAAWLVKQGARYLVLVSRSGQISSEDTPILEAMQAAGVQVLMASLDVTDDIALRAFLDEIEMTHPPLRGVFHAAMVLDDCAINELDENSWSRVLAPKMLGAWNLHRYTQRFPLDFFVLYSSASVLLGNHGQGNYVAGNMFLEKLAQFRHHQGLPAFTISWGALAKVGYLSRNMAMISHLDALGLQIIDPQHALDMLGILLQEQRQQITASIMDWGKLDKVWSETTTRMRWAQLQTDQFEDHEVSDGFFSVLSRSLGEMAEEEQLSVVSSYLQQKLIQMLGLPTDGIDQQKKLTDLGLDSLLAMEFRNSIKRDLGVTITVMHLLRPQSIADLAARIVAQMGAASSERQANTYNANNSSVAAD